MMAQIGWIRLYRKILASAIWEHDEPYDRRSAWIDLLLMANHKDKEIIFNGRATVVKQGQRITSIRILADRWHWSRDKVKRYLDALEKLEMITTDRDNHRTLLTIVNYSVYQGESDTDKSADKSADKSQTRMNKNDKEKKNKGKISTFGNYDQREAQEDDIYTILSRKGKKG
ncbi:MAG: hypothetical protein IKE94_05510 [Aeriscardovia sp.]|nr:hypothetical protein [Aeriscardovia sp.]